MVKDSSLRKLAYRERRLEREQRHLIHDKAEEAAVVEEVFDKPTLMTIYHIMNRGILKSLLGVVKSGKEARVYRGVAPDGKDLAVKIYLTTSAEFKRGMLPYIEGDFRFRKVRRDTRSLVYAWSLKEFKNLTAAHEAGVKVPKPIHVENNVLVMEFLGERGVPSPLLKEVELRRPEAVYFKVLGFVKTLYTKAELVHGDLSEYNIIIHAGEPYIFDMSQAVPLGHPLANRLFLRDLYNLNRYFGRLGVEVEEAEKVYKQLVEGEFT